MDYSRLGKMMAATALMAGNNIEFRDDYDQQLRELQLRNSLRPPTKTKAKSKAVLKRRAANKAARKQRKNK